MKSQWIIKVCFYITDRLSHCISLQFFAWFLLYKHLFEKKAECGILMSLLVGSAVYVNLSIQDEPLLRRTTECQLNFMSCHVNDTLGRYRPKLHSHAHFTANHSNLNFVEICWAISERNYAYKQTGRQTRDHRYSSVLSGFVTKCIINNGRPDSTIIGRASTKTISLPKPTFDNVLLFNSNTYKHRHCKKKKIVMEKYISLLSNFGWYIFL
jgi:hypothetical protein